jgi:hypothetical protein
MAHDSENSANLSSRVLARALLDAAPMIAADMKKVLRDALIGFGIGLVAMLTISYGATSLGGARPAAATSAQ